MKKGKLFRFLSIASCAVLLTGCESDALWGLGGKWNSFVDWFKDLVGIKKEESKQEEKKEDTPETPEEEPKVMPTIETRLVVDELPSEVLVDEEIDFDDYVSVYGSSASYTVALADEASADIAKVEGHKLTVTGEGTVSYKVSVDGKTESGSFSTIDALRKNFREFSKTIEDDYVAYHLDVDTETYNVSLGGAITHTEHYTFDEYFSSDDEGYSVAGGYVEVEDEVYSYLLDVVEVPAESEEEEPTYVYGNPQFKIYGDEPSSISAVTGSFGLKSSDFSVSHGSTQDDPGVFSKDCLVLPGTNVNLAKVNKILAGNADLSNYNYTFAGAYVEQFGSMTFEDEVTGAKESRPVYSIVPLYTSTSYPDPVYFIDMLFAVVQDDNRSVDAMDQFIASEQVPQGLSFSLYENVLNMFASQSSFTLDTVYGSYINSQMIPSYYAALYGLPFDDATGEVKAYVSPNQIHTEEVGLEHLSFGFIEQEDPEDAEKSVVYSYSFVADEVEPVEVTEPAADVEGGFPAHAVYEMYVANEMSVQIPGFTSENEDIYYEIYNDAGEGNSYYSIYMDCTEEEYYGYLATLQAKGWSIISEYDEETTDFTLRFADTTATCQLIDYFDYYGQYLVSFSYDPSLTNGHYVAVETDYESLSDLGAQYNYSFLKSGVKVVNPITSQLTTAYESIYVNDVSASAQQYNFGTDEEADLHTIVTQTASFAGKTGMTLLLYLAYLSTPVSSASDRYCLGDVIYSLFRADYLDDAEMSVSVVYDSDTFDIYDVKISFRVLWGQISAGYYAYWGFDTTFSNDAIPELEIEFPVQEVELP